MTQLSPRTSAGRGYLLTAVRPLMGLLLAAVAVTVVADPYLLRGGGPELWRSAPMSMRLAKPLQLIARQPLTVFLGNSRTLLGIDAGATGSDAYNFGICGLTAAELEVATRLVLDRTAARRLVINLDLTMFCESPDFPAGWGPQADAPRQLAESLAAALLSFDALKDAGRVLFPTAQRGWLRSDGLMKIAVANADAREWEFTHGIGELPARIAERRFAALDRLLAACRQRNVEALLYLPPVHPRFAHIIDSRDASAVAEYRRAIERIAARYACPVWDFSRPAALSVAAENDAGELFYDLSHFTPTVGDTLLERMRLKPVSEGTRTVEWTADLPKVAGLQAGAVRVAEGSGNRVQ